MWPLPNFCGHILEVVGKKKMDFPALVIVSDAAMKHDEQKESWGEKGLFC